MAFTKHDYWETSDDTYLLLNSVNDWGAQTFTASASYDLTKIELKVFRQVGDDFGSAYCEIQGVDGGGDPDGVTAATSDAVAPASVPEVTSDWVTFTFSTPYSITSSNQYAIVLYTTAANSSNYIAWRVDSAAVAYESGASNFSNNAGSSWAGPYVGDTMFRTYSGSSASYVDISATIAAASGLTVSATKLTYQDVSATIAASSGLTVVADVKGGVVENYSAGNTRRLVVAGNDSIWYENN